MKDLFAGLPRDVQGQLIRDLGEVGRAQAVSYAGAKAIRTFAVDVGMFYGLNALLQTGLGMMLHDQSASDVEKEYTGLLSRTLDRIREHPLDALNPLGFLDTIAGLSPLSQNEPGKTARILWTYASDGTALYLRTPIGKIGEEFVGWLQQPLQMARNAEGILARPITNTLMNDRGFSRQVYDPDAKGVGGVASNIGRIAWEFMRSQVPETQFTALSRIASGQVREGDVAQTVAPFLGFTVSRGAPGGPEVGLMLDAERQNKQHTLAAMSGINDLIRSGKTGEAVQQMTDLGMSKARIAYRLKVAEDPRARLSPYALRKFEQQATSDQRAAMQRLQQQSQAPAP